MMESILVADALDCHPPYAGSRIMLDQMESIL
jgi:hypothetical protein